MIQNQDEMIKQGTLKTRYGGIFDCTKRILQTEGFMYLWRGNVPNCVRYIPTQGFNFAFKDKIHNLFPIAKDAHWAKRLGSDCFSGGLAGSLCMLLVYPLDYARTRLANDATEKGHGRQYSGRVRRRLEKDFQI